jgi:hypothetical protein
MSDSSAMSKEEFLAGFGAVRPVIEGLLDDGHDRDWSLRIGSAEASLRRDKDHPHVVLYLSTAYSWGPYARIWCSSEALRDRLAAVLGAVHGGERVKAEGESVKLFLGPQAVVGYLIPLLEAMTPSH